MIITPARFEDEVNKVLNDNNRNKGHDLMVLMFDTLESLGYGADIKLLKDRGSDDTAETTGE